MIVTLVLIVSSILALFMTVKAGNYTWNGGISTAWGTSSNWTPNGVPSTNDTVTIVTGSNNVYLSAKTEAKHVTVTSGTLNMQGNELAVNGNSFFNGGTITNGLLTLTGTNHTFSGTTIDCKVSARCTRAFLNGSTFNDSLKIIIPSTGRVHTSKGGNTFNGPVSIKDSAIAGIILADSLPDIFNSTLDIYNESTANIFIAHRATGNQFNGTVTFNGPNIYSNYYGTATYDANIILNSASGNFFFGYSTGSCTQNAGKKLSIGGSGISSGQIYLRNFVSLDSSSNILLSIQGSSAIYFESGSKFYDSVYCNAPNLYLNGSKFYNVTYFENNGSSNVISTGGCYYGKQLTFLNKTTSTAMYSLANSYTDTFALGASFLNSAKSFALNKGLFFGKVIIDNDAVGGEGFFFASTGSCVFKDSLKITKDYTPGIKFGSNGGTTIIDSTGTLYFQTGCGGAAYIANLTKLGISPQVFNEGSDQLNLGPNNIWNGNFNFEGKHVGLNGNTFNSTVHIKVYPTSTYSSNGGNVFNGNTIIQDSSATSHSLYLANSSPDDFNGDVTFTQKGTGVNLYPSYTAHSSFASNVTVDGTSAISFGSNGGKIVFDGSISQSINKSGSYNPSFKKLELNKPSGKVKLNTSITLIDSIVFKKGVIISDTVNLISINDNGKAIGMSDSSYVHGCVRKIGNDPFVFPLGDTVLVAGSFHGFGITAPDSINDEFIASYFASNSGITDTLDSMTISNCEYWKLKHPVGSSSVNFTAYFNSNNCIGDIGTLKTAVYRSGTWKRYGIQDLYHNNNKGHFSSIDTLKILNTSNALITYGEIDSVSGYTCKHAISIDGLDYEQDYIVGNSNEFWFKMETDAPGVAFFFDPIVDSTKTHLVKVSMYAGTTCSDKILLYSRDYLDDPNDTLLGNKSIDAAIYSINTDTTYYAKINFEDLDYNKAFTLRTVPLNYLKAGHNPDIALSVCVRDCENIITNGNFSSVNNTCVSGEDASQYPAPFRANCIECWRASHGSPEFDLVDNVPIMGGYGINVCSEGIARSFNLLNLSKTYILSYSSRLDPVRPSSNINGKDFICGLKTSTSGFTFGNTFDAIPNPELTLNTQTLTSSSWVDAEVCFKPIAQFNTIWFYPNPTNSVGVYWVNVNDIQLFELNPDIEDKPFTCTPVTIGPECPSLNPNIHYSWSPNNETTSYITVNPLTTTTYTLTTSYIVGGITQCSDISTVTVTVSSPSIVTNPNINNESCFGNDGSICLSAVGNGVITYNWSNSETTDCISSLSAGIYSVTMTDESGCSYTGSYTIVESILIANAGVDVTNCSGGSLVLGGLPIASNGIEPYTYSWSPSTSLSSSTDPYPVCTNSSSQLYTVTVTDGTGCSATDQVQFNVSGNTAPTADAGPPTISVSEPSSCLTSGVGTIGTSNSSSYTYQWTCSSPTAMAAIGNPNTDVTTLTHVFDVNNHQYYYFLKVTDPSNACYNMDKIRATFAACRRRRYIDNSNNAQENSVKIHPNPAKDFATLTIEAKGEVETYVEIYNILGNLLFAKRYRYEIETDNLNLSNFITGIYVLKYQMSSGESGIVKFIME